MQQNAYLRSNNLTPGVDGRFRTASGDPSQQRYLVPGEVARAMQFVPKEERNKTVDDFARTFDKYIKVAQQIGTPFENFLISAGLGITGSLSQMSAGLATTVTQDANNSVAVAMHGTCRRR